MKLTQSQYERIADCLPKQRGNVSLSNLQFINAILYVLENGCRWRCLPSEFGNWHTIYVRMNRWSKNGVLDLLFKKMQTEQLISIRIESLSMDSTYIKVHLDGMEALKKQESNPLENLKEVGPQKYIWLPQLLNS